MSIFGKNKLQKLTIDAYEHRTRRTRYVLYAGFSGSFEAMYNPESYSQKYNIALTSDKKQGINSSGKEVKYKFSPPQKLNIKLILDGTRLHETGISRLLPSRTVTERVEQFLALAYEMNPNTHEPNFLIITWGDGLNFICRLASVTVKYTAFNRDGTPLRAELDADFVADDTSGKRVRKENKQSPDVTHMRVIKAGDTLPMLCKEIYGSTQYYLKVAEANGLNNFRNLTPGETLYFPPLEA